MAPIALVTLLVAPRRGVSLLLVEWHDILALAAARRIPAGDDRDALASALIEDLRVERLAYTIAYLPVLAFTLSVSAFERLGYPGSQPFFTRYKVTFVPEETAVICLPSVFVGRSRSYVPATQPWIDLPFHLPGQHSIARRHIRRCPVDARLTQWYGLSALDRQIRRHNRANGRRNHIVTLANVDLALVSQASSPIRLTLGPR